MFAGASCALQAAYLVLVERSGAKQGVGSDELLLYNAILSLPFLALVRPPSYCCTSSYCACPSLPLYAQCCTAVFFYPVPGIPCYRPPRVVLLYCIVLCLPFLAVVRPGVVLHRPVLHRLLKPCHALPPFLFLVGMRPPLMHLGFIVFFSGTFA